MEAAAGKSVVIDAEAINTTEETVIIAALYEDNRLAEVCTGNTLTINVPKGATSYTHHIKLFAWDSLNGLRAVTKDKLL